MSLKEFDAKQFLLEKGEQVGLGIALTLMVLMLIFSLFMPSKGFFSGSPAAKAEPMNQGAKDLQNALATRQPPDNYKAPETKGRLIDLDTAALDPRFYEMTGYLFTPTERENPDRRPPEILALDEAAAKFLHVPIDTYIFSRNYDGIYVLRDPEKKAAANAQGGANNPLAKIYGQGMPNMPPGGGGASRSMQDAMKRFQGPNRAGAAVQGADGKEEYTATQVPLANVSMSEHFARQLQPARMVVIEGSFPYKRQLEEFKTKLRLDTIQAVLNETMKVESEKDKKAEQLYSFRFLGIEVQRSEVDAGGKTIDGWKKLDLDAPYKIWLMNSSLPFEPDDPKYNAVKFDGLVMPLLREFHEESQQKQMGMMMPGMMPPGGSGNARPDTEEPRKHGKSKYEDLAKDLPTINDTLTKLAGVSPKKIARPPDKFRGHEAFSAFGSSTPIPAADGGKEADAGTPGDTIPEHCLVRVVDLDIHPGKFYRYRFKVRMANPNYLREDVASTAYKAEKELKSNKWYELPQTVSVPPETVYYIVDQKYLKETKGEKHAAESPQAKMWKNDPSRGGNQVVFQLHRWVESAPIDVKGEPVPIGDWAIADRVLVSRGDFIAQTVKVDLPVWKYTQDAFVLPAEDQKARKVRGKVPSGVSVNFGEENSDTQTILVDFEGGKETIGGEAKLSDTSAIEVLMLSPDGKLRARNSAEDAADEKRVERREEVQKRIEDLREGKAGGAGGGGGLDAGRSK